MGWMTGKYSWSDYIRIIPLFIIAAAHDSFEYLSDKFKKKPTENPGYPGLQKDLDRSDQFNDKGSR